MKIFGLILVFLTFCNAWARAPEYFQGPQRKSVLEWKELDTDKWLSLKSWKVERKYKDKNKSWKENYRYYKAKEPIGRVISCIGKCQVFAGTNPYFIQSRSLIREGDEFETLKDSYAWIFLFDGSLIRISPETSVNFNEFNIGEIMITSPIRWYSLTKTTLTSISFILYEYRKRLKTIKNG